MKIRAWLWTSFFFLLVLMGGLSFLITTQIGLQWAYQLSAPMVPGTLKIESLRGRLIGPIEFEGLNYSSTGIDVTVKQAQLNWQPAAVLNKMLRVTLIDINDIVITIPKSKQQQTQQAIVLPDIQLPIAIDLQSVHITNIEVSTETTQKIDTLKLKAHSQQNQIILDHLDIKAERSELHIAGKFTPEGDYLIDSSVNWKIQVEATEAINGSAVLSGTLAHLKIQHKVSGAIEATLDAEIKDALSSLKWNAKLQLQRFEAKRLNANWPEISASGEITSIGQLNSFVVSGDVASIAPEIGATDTRFEIHSINDVLHLNTLEIKPKNTNTTLRVSGELYRRQTPVQFALTADWQALTWPLTQPVMLRSPKGHVSVKGDFEQYQFTLDGDIVAPDAPPATISAQGSGNQQSVRFNQLKASTLKGQVEGAGHFTWAPQTDFMFDLTASNIDPGAQWPQWPGQLGGAIQLQGKQGTKGITTTAQLKSLQGELRGYPLHAVGEVTWDQETLIIDGLDLTSGSAQLKLAGQLQEQWDIQWSLIAEDLQALLPDVYGKINAKGSLKGQRSAPHIIATVTAHDLNVQENRINQLHGDININLADNGQIHTDLKATGIAAANKNWKSAMLSIDGTIAEHKIEARLGDKTNEQAKVIIHAGLHDQRVWQGRLEQADVQLESLGAWRLLAPNDFSIATGETGQVQLGPWCWQQDKSKLCLGAQKDNSVWALNAEATGIALAKLQPRLSDDIQLTGTANGRLSAAYQGDADATGKLELNTSSGSIVFKLADTEQVSAFNQGSLTASLTAQGLDAKFALPFVDGSKIDMQFTLPKWRLRDGMRAQQTLQGQMRGTLKSVAMVGQFLPGVEAVQGGFVADLILAGTLDKPIVSGQAIFSEGSMELPRLGVKLQRVAIKLNSQQDNTVFYTMTANSGDGDLLLTGKTILDAKQKWPTDLSLEGKDFTVVNIPDLLVVASPKLSIAIRGTEIKVDGEVTVPRAKIEIKKLPQGSVAISRDVVIVNASQDDKTEQQGPWLVRSSVELILGDRVEIDALGLRGSLGGKLLLVDEPGKLTVARGKLSINNGIYQAYGQDLTIEHGRFIFTDSPVDDPGLDVRAVRKVGEVTAGINLSGALKEPLLTLFSTPTMNESNILSYIILGRPPGAASGGEGAMLANAAAAFGLARGEGLAKKIGTSLDLEEVRIESSDNGFQSTSLVLGRYLSPKLYIRYSAGLFEINNIVQLQYQLSKHLQIQTESGTRTGADIFYTIER